MTITALQRTERKTRIGASDAPVVIMGKVFERTRYRLWLEKTGRETDLFDGNLNTELGDFIEPMIGKLAARELNIRVYRCHQSVIHPNFDFIGANLDFRVGRGLPMVPVECKFTHDRSALVEPKVQDVIQLSTQMACTGAPHGYLAYLVSAFRLEQRIYKIDRIPEVERGLITQLCDFWYGHVLADIPPSFDSLDDVDHWYARSKADVIEATPEIAAACAKLRRIRDLSKRLETKGEELALAIKTFVGEHDTLMFEGKKLATWKTNRDSAKFDADLLIADLIGRIRAWAQDPDAAGAYAAMAELRDWLGAADATAEAAALIARIKAEAPYQKTTTGARPLLIKS